MPESHDEIPCEDLSAQEIQELLGELGQQLTSEQLQVLLQLVNACDDLDEALEALDQVAKAA